ncbi:MAG: FdtA/QdtA family cupin domain-containing protein [Cyclobacteriaceae bacterium]|nr:FdtA/QdtA family cupin domain-containing protein [Cyclobacteriaceae bacterium]
MKSIKDPFLFAVKEYRDSNGIIGIVEDSEIPMAIRRVFWLTEVPDNTMRGGHAHHQSQQVLICFQGEIMVHLEDLTGKGYDYCLKPQGQALYIPPLVWGEYTFHKSAQAICLASDLFDEDDYVRDYQVFKSLQHANQLS